MILRLWVQFSSIILDGNGVKAIPESILGTQFWFKMIIKRKIKVGYLYFSFGAHRQKNILKKQTI
jgi:hypothetical protein